MGIISGYICLILLILLLLKFLTKKLQWKRADRFLMRFHKYAAALFLASGIAHLILVFHVLSSRQTAVWLTGAISVFIGFVLVITCHGIKNQKKSLFFHRLFSLVLLLATVFHLLFYWTDFSGYQKKISEISVREVELSEIPDGVYTGESDVGYIYAKVQLSVKNGKIVKAELLEHRNERGSTAENILESMISKQKIDVDAVSGATNSSQVIKKACENAFRGN